MSWSPRGRWWFAHYVPLVFVVVAVVFSVSSGNWATLFSNAILVCFLLLGDGQARQAWYQGHHRGVMDSLEAIQHAETAGEYGRLVSVRAMPPWADGRKPTPEG